MIAECNACGRPYHLNQRNDLAGDDCGEVWISEEHLGLEFACNTCLHPVAAPADLDEILDAGEAAAVAGLSEAALTEAAMAGQLRHRRTSGGVLLFERRDVVTFVQGRR
jgi:hypothetical protein